MIKAKAEPVKKYKVSYPYIGQYKRNEDLLVLFTEYKCGVILRASSESAGTGTYWTCFIETDFMLFRGTVTLENCK